MIEKNLKFYLFKKYKKYSYFSIALILLSNVMWLFNTFLNISMTNAAIDKNPRLFIRQLALVIICMFVLNIFQALNKLSQSKIQKHMSNDLRSIYGKNLIYKDLVNVEETGHHISRLTQDISYINNTGLQNVFTLVNGIVSILISLISAIMIHWSYIIIFPLTMGLSLVIPKIYNSKYERESQNYSNFRSAFVGSARDLISGINIFKRTNNSSAFLKNMDDISENLENGAYIYNKKTTFYGTIITFFSVLSQIIYVLATLVLIYKGYISIGAIVGLLGISQNVYTAMSQVFGSLPMLASVSPIFSQYFNNDYDILHDGFLNLDDNVESIVLDNIDVNYGTKNILKDFSYKFEKGKKYAIIGESGTGKSTLLKVLLNEKKIDKGNIKVNGIDYHDINRETIYSKMGYITQDSYLFNKTIRENITLGENFSNDDLNAALKRASIFDFTNSLDEKENTKIINNGDNLSGGQRQRLVLAREYIRRKNWILMDEPTSSLDNLTKMQIEKELLEDKNLTLIYVIHPRSDEELKGFDEVISLNESK